VSVNSAVRLDVMLGGVLGVFSCVDVMTVGQVGMMRRRFMVPFLVMTGGFVVMTRSEFVMLRCLLVMLCCLVGHGEFLSSCRCRRGT
jgi:hypothetical protein